MPFKVYYAVGHGVRSDGSQDPGAGGEWDEQEAGDVIVAEMARLTAQYRDVAVFSEAYTNDPNYQGTPRDADEWGADLIVSIHHDCSTCASGMFAYHDPDDRRGSRALSDSIRDAVVDAGFPHNSNHHGARDNLGLLNESVRRGMACVLVEVGRIGQPEINTDAKRRRMAAAIVAGVVSHLGIEEDEDMPITDAEWKRLRKMMRDVADDVVKSRLTWFFHRRHFFGSSLGHRWRKMSVSLRNLTRDTAGIDDAIDAIREGDPITEDELREVFDDVGITPELIADAIADAGAEMNAEAFLDALADRLTE